MSISDQDITILQQATNAGRQECKEALERTDGRFADAAELLGLGWNPELEKRPQRPGKIATYSAEHGTIGIVLEVQCEREETPDHPLFNETVQKLLSQIATGLPLYVNRVDVPHEVLDDDMDLARSLLFDKSSDEQDSILQEKQTEFFRNACYSNSHFLKIPMLP